MFPSAHKTGVLASVAALLLGFVQAPFFHVHGEVLEHSHGSGLAHMHLRVADDGDEGVHMEARTADDDAVDVIWSMARNADSGFHFDFDQAERAVVAAPALPAAGIAVVTLHSHDPPARQRANPRAPPA
jgi:hypothetical protein